MKTICIMMLVSLTALPMALAQGNDQATIGLFVVPENDTPRNVCNIEAKDCEDPELSVSGETYQSYVVYICVFNGDPVDGIAMAEFGIDYDGVDGSGVDIFSDVSCSSLSFTSSNWPAPKSSATFTWVADSACQTEEPGGAGTGVTAVVGAFTVFAYSSDVLSITRKSSGQVNVSSCLHVLSPVATDRLGSVAFSEDGSAEGNPGCTRAVIEDATWGTIKKNY